MPPLRRLGRRHDMSLKQLITEDMKAAMRASDA